MQELGVLEMGETQARPLFQAAPPRPGGGQGDLCTHNRCGLEQTLLLWGQAVDTRCQGSPAVVAPELVGAVPR